MHFLELIMVPWLAACMLAEIKAYSNRLKDKWKGMRPKAHGQDCYRWFESTDILQSESRELSMVPQALLNNLADSCRLIDLGKNKFNAGIWIKVEAHINIGWKCSGACKQPRSRVSNEASSRWFWGGHSGTMFWIKAGHKAAMKFGDAIRPPAAF